MGTVDLRCEGTLHGRVTDKRWFEVKCRRRACGYQRGTVILHTIDIQSGKVVSTKRFADPRYKKESHNASDDASASVRSA